MDIHHTDYINRLSKLSDFRPSEAAFRNNPMASTKAIYGKSWAWDYLFFGREEETLTRIAERLPLDWDKQDARPRGSRLLQPQWLKAEHRAVFERYVTPSVDSATKMSELPQEIAALGLTAEDPSRLWKQLEHVFGRFGSGTRSKELNALFRRQLERLGDRAIPRGETTSRWFQAILGAEIVAISALTLTAGSDVKPATALTALYKTYIPSLIRSRKTIQPDKTLSTHDRIAAQNGGVGHESGEPFLDDDYKDHALIDILLRAVRDLSAGNEWQRTVHPALFSKAMHILRDVDEEIDSHSGACRARICRNLTAGIRHIAKVGGIAPEAAGEILDALSSFERQARQLDSGDLGRSDAGRVRDHHWRTGLARLFAWGKPFHRAALEAVTRHAKRRNEYASTATLALVQSYRARDDDYKTFLLRNQMRFIYGQLSAHQAAGKNLYRDYWEACRPNAEWLEVDRECTMNEYWNQTLGYSGKAAL